MNIHIRNGCLMAAHLLLLLTLPAYAANITENETDNDVFNGTTVYTLNNGEFGLGALVAANSDFWRRTNVSTGDLIFAATSTADATMLNVIDHDGATVVENPPPPEPEPNLGSDVDSGYLLGSAIAGLKANNPGNLYFEVINDADPVYDLCTVVADPVNDVGQELELISQPNDLTANATKYSKPVMFGQLDEVDTYSFQAIAGTKVMVILDNDPDGDGNATTFIEILQADSTPIAVSEISSLEANATGVAEIITTGTHYVRITDEGVDGEYSFVICGAVLGKPAKGSGVIGNKVWFDRNQDGIQDNNEPGVAKQQLQLLADDMVTVLASTRTRRDGSYKFTGVANGTYFVKYLNPPGSAITLQNTPADDTLDSDADPLTGITDLTVVADGIGNSDTDIGVHADNVTPCDDTTPAAGDDVFDRVRFAHASSKKLAFAGKRGTIDAADLTNPMYVKVCVYYSTDNGANYALQSEHYVGVTDPGFKLKPGKLIYNGASNVTGLKKLKISSGVGTSRIRLRASGLGAAPIPGVTNIVVVVETDQLALREDFTSATGIIQKGDKLRARKSGP